MVCSSLQNLDFRFWEVMRRVEEVIHSHFRQGKSIEMKGALSLVVYEILTREPLYLFVGSDGELLLNSCHGRLEVLIYGGGCRGSHGEDIFLERVESCFQINFFFFIRVMFPN